MNAGAQRPVIHLDDLEFFEIGQLKPGAPDGYHGARLAPISSRIGARKLGYNLTEVPPGKAAFPRHNHYAIEEMFFILAGEGELRLGDDCYPVRAGDVVACPTGDASTAHQLRNTSADQPLRYLAVSTADAVDLVQYPDSGKTGAAHVSGRDAQGLPIAVRIMNRSDANLDYWDGE